MSVYPSLTDSNEIPSSLQLIRDGMIEKLLLKPKNATRLSYIQDTPVFQNYLL